MSKRTLMRVLVAVAIVVGGLVVRDSFVAATSDGCTLMNVTPTAVTASLDFTDEGWFAGDQIFANLIIPSGSTAVAAQIRIQAGSGDTPTTVATLAAPGIITYTIPTTGTLYRVSFVAVDSNGLTGQTLSFNPTCIPGPDPSTTTTTTTSTTTTTTTSTTTTTIPSVSSGCDVMNAIPTSTTSSSSFNALTFNAGEYIGAIVTLPEGSAVSYVQIRTGNTVRATGAAPGTVAYQVPSAGSLTLLFQPYDSNGEAGGLGRRATLDYFCTTSPIVSTPTTTTTSTTLSLLKCSLPMPAGYQLKQGTSGNDTITIPSGKWYVKAGDGNDRITGFSGNDIICGEGGNDVIDMGSGNDYAEGGPGNDTINGGSGTDTGIDSDPGTKTSSIEKTTL